MLRCHLTSFEIVAIMAAQLDEISIGAQGVSFKNVKFI